MTTLTPRPHQAEALDKLRLAYGTTDRAQLHWTCGAGKTLVGRWLAQDSHADTVLVALPTLALVAQTLAEWQAAGGWAFDPLVVCSDPTTADAWRIDPEWWAEHQVTVSTDAPTVTRFLANRRAGRARVLFTTYHSLPVVERAVRAARATVDLGIADEAHRLAGEPDPRFRLFLDDRRLPIRRRLFMTATPVVARVDADTPWTVLSMDDVAAFGPVAHRYPLHQAIGDGRSCDYQVLVLDTAGGAGDLTWEQRTMAALAAAASQHGLTRVLSFHGRLAKARAAAAAADGMVLPDGRTMTATALAGTDPTSDRLAALAELADAPAGTVRVVTNARCLSEGVNVPAVDAVLFSDPKTSDTDVVQAAGRAMRPAPGKTRGTIIIPVTVPADVDDDAYLSTGPFAAVWTVLRVLRDLDSRMAAEMDRFYRRPTGFPLPGELAGQPDSGPVLGFDLPPSVDVAKLVTRIVAAAAAGGGWDSMLELLRRWANEHGHTAVPASEVVDGRMLGRWTQQQRAAYNAGALSPDRAARLEAIPHWGWTTGSALWTIDHAAVLAAAATAGGMRLNDPDFAGQRLPGRHGRQQRITRGRWVAEQRVARRQGQLDDRHAAACERIDGWTWTAVPPADADMVDTLAGWVDDHGDANVPAGTIHRGRRLGAFVTELRRRRFTGCLPQPLADELAAVTPAAGAGALDWRDADTRWDLACDALEQYAARTGGCDIPEGWQETLQPYGYVVALYVWATRQRFQHRHDGDYPPHRAARLERVQGWQWERERKVAVNVGVGVRQHGTWLASHAGCPCGPCTAAAKAAGGAKVSVAAARGHLRILEARVGRRALPAIAAMTGLNKKTVDAINGTNSETRSHIHPEIDAAVRALTVDAVLAWIEEHPSPRDLIPAGPYLDMLADMVGRGWPKAWIARELGGNSSALQVGGRSGGGQYVRRESADAIRDLYERLAGRRAPAGKDRTFPLPPLSALLVEAS